MLRKMDKNLNSKGVKIVIEYIFLYLVITSSFKSSFLFFYHLHIYLFILRAVALTGAKPFNCGGHKALTGRTRSLPWGDTSGKDVSSYVGCPLIASLAEHRSFTSGSLRAVRRESLGNGSFSLSSCSRSCGFASSLCCSYGKVCVVSSMVLSLVVGKFLFQIHKRYSVSDSL